MGLLRIISDNDARRRTAAYMRRARRAGAHADELSALDDAALLARARECSDAKCADEAQALALGREAVLRERGLDLTCEQLACALALADGHVAEASTGSGKTLAAVAAAYILASRHEHVHIVTVNEYLVCRDAGIAEPILGRLGVDVAYTVHADDALAKRSAYRARVLYATATELGFDYLRDGMCADASELICPEPDCALIDEVDSVLIDEARTPLIIAGEDKADTSAWAHVTAAVDALERERHVTVDEAKRQVMLTETGHDELERTLMWPIYSTPERANMVRQALLAKFVYRRDRDYIVRDGAVEIVDENTGRVMEGRRWSDCLHQAVESKEHVEIRPENVTSATVTLQNFFRLYKHLCGMSGTAMSADAEFGRVFGMGCVRIGDHKPCIREDEVDLVFATDDERTQAMVDDICRRHKAGQPVLVGTQSVGDSERVAAELGRRGVDAVCLNARDNAAEAAIVACAGEPGQVTVSTNMAGRGTDIKLGGSPEWMAERRLHAQGYTLAQVTDELAERTLADCRRICEAQAEAVREAGGLAVVSMGRNENRRIDDQLRGRAGRQGDPGSSQFFVSLDDDILRLFNADAVERVRKRVGGSGPLQSKLVGNIIADAQERIGERDAEARASIVDYDDVSCAQYRRHRERRAAFLNPDASALDRAREALDRELSDLERAHEAQAFLDECGMADAESARGALKSKIAELGDAAAPVICRQALFSLDRAWARHLTDNDALVRGAGLSGIAGRDPLVAYKAAASDLEAEMVRSARRDFCERMLTMRIVHGERERAPKSREEQDEPSMSLHARGAAGLIADIAPMAATGAATGQNRAARRAAARKRKTK